jgi:hypothetical protein
VKLDDQSSRGVVKHLMTRVVRRGFVSDGRAAAAQADAVASSIGRFGEVHVPCESVAEVEEEHLPRSVRG